MGRRATPEAAERAVQEAGLWRDYRDAFQSLADEQRAFVRAMQKGDRRLCAYCGYNSDMTPLESELVEQGLACLLYRLESGTWQLGEGPNEDLKARFEALATRAGIALHQPHDIAARDFWLHRLCLHLRRTENKGFFGGTDTGGYIEDVCQTSATFCSWLERKALEHAEPSKQQVPTSQPIERGVADATQEQSDESRRLIAGASTPELQGFAHSKDYISVSLRGKSYTLTSRQAQMIEILHRARESGQPDVAIAHILESLGTRNSRWQDTFKTNPDARRALVTTGRRKGTLCLNL